MNTINIDVLCLIGNLNKLIELQQENFIFEYENAIDNASRGGHVHVLEWFKNSGYEFKYSKIAIRKVSANGFVHVLEWFKNSGYKFKYDKNAIYYASINGNINVLEWFKKSGYKLKYNKSVINKLHCINHLWWVNYSSYASKWFKNNNYKTRLNYIKQYKH
jgi:hypothetical protein